MKNLKLFFSALTVTFGILGLTKVLSTDMIVNGVLFAFFICLYAPFVRSFARKRLVG